MQEAFVGSSHTSGMRPLEKQRHSLFQGRRLLRRLAPGYLL